MRREERGALSKARTQHHRIRTVLNKEMVNNQIDQWITSNGRQHTSGSPGKNEHMAFRRQPMTGCTAELHGTWPGARQSCQPAESGRAHGLGGLMVKRLTLDCTS